MPSRSSYVIDFASFEAKKKKKEKKLIERPLCLQTFPCDDDLVPLTLTFSLY